MAATMKVAVSVTIEIEPEDWTLNYGITGAQAIREDVRSYVAHNLQEGLRGAGVESAKVTLR